MSRQKKVAKEQASKVVKEEMNSETPKGETKKELSIVDVANKKAELVGMINQYMVQQKAKKYPCSRLVKQIRDLKRFDLDYKVSYKQQ